ncbi:hypothetical protein QVA66_02220 [Staphylococcus chromogenes]|nr:hypothetical protein [Staphylococcus chromogenes]
MTSIHDYASTATPGRALFLALWIFVFILLEACSLLISPSQVIGALFQMGTMFPYAMMTIGYYNLLRGVNKYAMRAFGAFNALGVVIQLCSIPDLLEISPDVHGYEIGQIVAEILMCIAIFILVQVMSKSPLVPHLFAYAYGIFGIFWLLALWLWVAYPHRSIFDPPTYISGWIAQGGFALFLTAWGLKKHRQHVRGK